MNVSPCQVTAPIATIRAGRDDGRLYRVGLGAGRSSRFGGREEGWDRAFPGLGCGGGGGGTGQRGGSARGQGVKRQEMRSGAGLLSLPLASTLLSKASIGPPFSFTFRLASHCTSPHSLTHRNQHSSLVPAPASPTITKRSTAMAPTRVQLALALALSSSAAVAQLAAKDFTYTNLVSASLYPFFGLVLTVLSGRSLTKPTLQTASAGGRLGVSLVALTGAGAKAGRGG